MKKIFLNKKLVFVSLVVIAFAIVMIRSKIIYEQKLFPVSSLIDINNKELKISSLKGKHIKVFYLNKISSKNYNLVNKLLDYQLDWNHTIIISPSTQISNFKNSNILNNSISLVVDLNNNKLQKLFGIEDSDTGWILGYSEEGFLENKEQLSNANYAKILSNLVDNKEESGDIQPILNAIEKSYNKKDGIYFFTQGLKMGCSCLIVFEELENELINKGKKLELGFIGDISDFDLNNIKIERDSRIIATRVNEDVNTAVSNWNKQLNRHDFHLIFIRDNNLNYYYPLLTRNDYISWYSNKNKIQIEGNN